MYEKQNEEKIIKLNDILFDPDLSFEEIEERLEFVNIWQCLSYCETVHPGQISE